MGIFKRIMKLLGLGGEDHQLDDSEVMAGLKKIREYIAVVAPLTPNKLDDGAVVLLDQMIAHPTLIKLISVILSKV